LGIAIDALNRYTGYVRNASRVSETEKRHCWVLFIIWLVICACVTSYYGYEAFGWTGVVAGGFLGVIAGFFIFSIADIPLIGGD
jgi:hypothetical protein